MHRNTKSVPYLIYGRGALAQLPDLIANRAGNAAFIMDPSQRNREWVKTYPWRADDARIWANVDVEPTTAYVDELRDRLAGKDIQTVVGIGGGTVLDTAKAVSLMLTNPGGSANYQGWDLIKHPAAYHIGIPTLAGTGAEASRTAVLSGPTKKLGLNSDYTVFDQIILDADLTVGMDKAQWFYTGMDCYIHCVEALNGTFLNAFSRAYGEKAHDYCLEIFLDDAAHGDPEKDEKLIMASYLGGVSIAYSQVGACHALSYGLSHVLGYRHGIGNCIAFAALSEFYPEGVRVFNEMLNIQNITLPKNLSKTWSADDMTRMVETAKNLAPLWQNVYGEDWEAHATPERIRALYAML